jgi:aminomethyltransferase
MGLLAIQGPKAEAILSRVSKLALDGIRRFHATSGTVAGISCMVARTGYTGEDGFEIFVAAQYAEAVFEALLSAGAGDGLKPCGLGARDTLRMEAGLPLYGHELDRSISPLEAGLALFVKFGRGFIGESALAVQRDAGRKRHLVGIRTEDRRSIARQGYKLFRDGNEIGVVTSGTFAPSFDGPLAIGLVDAAADLRPGVQLMVEIRKRLVPAHVISLPFYQRQSPAAKK